jgi:acyl-CoA synthetase
MASIDAPAPTPTPAQTTFDHEAGARYYRDGLWHQQTLMDYFHQRAYDNPAGSMVTDGTSTLTNSETLLLASRLAARLRDHGIRAGDRVLVQLPNWPEFAVIYLALARLGAVIVPMMPTYGERELTFVVRTSEANTYITCSEFRGTDYLSLVRNVRSQCPSLKTLLIVRGEPENHSDALSFAALVGPDSGTPSEAELGPMPGPDDGHIIAFTSGTENEPKGCFHTWNSYSSAAKEHARATRFGPHSIELVPSPITHATGLSVGLLKPLLAGGSALLMDIWSPSVALALITQHRCTHLTGAPVFLAELLAAYDANVHDLSSWQVCLSAGAPITDDLLRSASDRLPSLRVLTGYGQSEGMLISLCDYSDSAQRASTVGRPSPGVRVRIVDDHGDDTAPGTVGEIWYQGPGAMMRYWGNPEATSAVITPDGWRSSGDAGFIDADGFLTLTSRVKDIIIRAGSNVSPLEVESLLVGHPDVVRVVVIGVPDPSYGERVCAVVVPSDPDRPPTLDTLRDYLLHQCKVARYKLPERVCFVDALPMTSTGKVRRREVVDLVAARSTLS